MHKQVLDHMRRVLDLRADAGLDLLELIGQPAALCDGQRAAPDRIIATR